MWNKDVTLRHAWVLLKTSFEEFLHDKSFIHGASLAYYTIVALVPMLYLAFLSIGYFLGQKQLIEIIANVAKEQIGIEDVTWLIDALTLIDIGTGNTVLKVVGIIVLIFSSSAIFNSLRTSLNTFFDVEIPEKKVTFLQALIARGVSFLMLSGVAFVVILFYFLETAFVSFGSNLLGDKTQDTWIYVIEHAGSIFSNILIFLFVFKYLHDGVVEWGIALRGSVFTGILLYLGQLIIKYYLTNFFFAASGGVAGTILVLLAWIYYSAQIIFLGAKITMVYARMTGRPIRMKPKFGV
jgi:membrane protein